MTIVKDAVLNDPDLESVDPVRLYDFCTTENQKKVVAAVIANNGSVKAAARQLERHDSTIRESWFAIVTRAAKQGYAPSFGYTNPVPSPFYVKGVSQMIDGDGNVKLQWVKSQIDQDQKLAHFETWVQGLCKEVKPLRKIKATGLKSMRDDLMNVYTITDAHVGMLAWEKEGDDNWNLEIAQETLTKAFELSIKNSPKARRCVVNQLGDFFHYDSMLPLTPTSSHMLDGDSRPQKMIQVGNDILTAIINMAAQHHEQVDVILAEGNHDMYTSMMLRDVYTRLYANNPHINIVDEKTPYYAIEHGKTMLGFHHGHKTKKDQLPRQFSAEERWAPMWGRTRFRYAHTGHFHSLDIKEHGGMRVTQHSTLAARDAYASHNNYQSLREATTYTYSSEYGQVASTTVTPDMFVVESDT